MRGAFGLRGRAPRRAPVGVHTAARRLRSWLAILSAALCIAPAGVAQAAKPLGASTSRAARAEAMRAIPQDKLDETARRKVSYVLSDISIYRRMPTQVIRCDPDLYVFMVNHPHIAVNMWEVLEVSQLSLEPTG